MVFFYDENHEYKNQWGEKYESVSGLMHEYEEQLDIDFISLRSAFRAVSETIYDKAKRVVHYSDPEIITEMAKYVTDDKYQQILLDAEILKAKWDDYNKERREYGTGRHSFYEEEDTLRGYKINPFDGLKYKIIPRQGSDTYDNSFFIPEVLKMRENVCMLECLITDHDAKVAGQEDVSFFKYLGGGQFGIFNKDYKTDKVMEYKSFFEKGGFRMLANELNYFMDCNFYQYSVKQSIYAAMQEKLGCKIFNNCLLHLPENGEPKYIKTLYYRKHAMYLLEKRATGIKNNS